MQITPIRWDECSMIDETIEFYELILLMDSSKRWITELKQSETLAFIIYTISRETISYICKIYFVTEICQNESELNQIYLQACESDIDRLVNTVTTSPIKYLYSICSAANHFQFWNNGPIRSGGGVSVPIYIFTHIDFCNGVLELI